MMGHSSLGDLIEIYKFPYSKEKRIIMKIMKDRCVRTYFIFVQTQEQNTRYTMHTAKKRKRTFYIWTVVKNNTHQ